MSQAFPLVVGAPFSLHIPQADPGARYRSRGAAMLDALREVLEAGVYVLGEDVERFEAEFAAYLGAGTAVSCANGTDALELALRALGLSGRRVATAAFNPVAVVAAIERAGAEPCLVDIETDSCAMAADDLRALVSREAGGPKPIAGVVAVHMHGCPVDLGGILAVCAEYGLRLIEDCSQAHGGSFAGRKLGTFGDAASFSFYPTKPLAALGDGGLVLARDPSVADRIRRLRQYGWNEDRVTLEPGVNSRLDALQAAILRLELRGLDRANARRRAIAGRYDDALAETATTPAYRPPGTEPVFHQYVIRTKRRDRLAEALRARGVGTAIHYALPIHRHPAYQGRLTIAPSGLARTEKRAAEVLSLPLYPELTDGQAARVAGALRDLA